jgi:hypothetical protein
VAASSFAVVSDGDYVYLHLPPQLGTTTTQGKAWVRLDAKEFTKGMESGAAPTTTDPLSMFEQLAAVDAEIEQVGTEEIRGVTTTHFRTRLDLTKSPVQPKVAPTGPLLEALRNVPVDVWLDDHDRPRRQRMTFALGAGGGSFTTTTEAYDFGTPVDIEIPPLDQVFQAGPDSLGALLSPAPRS